MSEYYYLLVLSFVGSVLLLAYFLKIYKCKKKEGDAYLIDWPSAFISFLLFLLFGSGFVFLLTDLPNVLANKTDYYEGNCHVRISEEARNSDASVEFQNHSISFPINLHNIKEGRYYCEVNYYKKTKFGTNLKLYNAKDGVLINP